MNPHTTCKTPEPCESRVIGFDSHPDTFTAALISGKTPAEAVVLKVFNKVPMPQLQSWAHKHTTSQDRIVLEASGNSFQVVRSLKAIQREAQVLESVQIGKLKEAHANNDKISAVRIGKAYLAGTAKTVWVPDAKTQERRDWFHAHRKVVQRTTQLQNRIQSYLSDNGLRLSQHIDPNDLEKVYQARAWSARQKCVLAGMFMELQHAQQQQAHWVSLMAQEVLQDAQLLSITRLCGIRDIIAFALGAIIGDIHRFAEPRKLVKYVGLDPAFDDSGESQWTGGIAGHGRKDLRGLLIQAAQSILRSNHPLAQWGRRLLARKSQLNLVVAAVARRLTVAVWYLMMGKWTQLEEIDARMNRKISKMLTHIGPVGFKTLDKTRAQLRDQVYESLKAGRVYVLDSNRTMGYFDQTNRSASAQTLPAQSLTCPHCGKISKPRAKAAATAQPQPSNENPPKPGVAARLD